MRQGLVSVFTIFFVVSTTLAGATLWAQTDQDDLTPIEIPQNQIPTYFCVLSFFELASERIKANQFDDVLKDIGIDAEAKTLRSRFLQVTTVILGLDADDPDYAKFEDDPAEWTKQQDQEIEKEIGQVIRVYDLFLQECDEEKLDSRVVHQNIVEQGRAIVGMAASAGPPLDLALRKALRLFEDDGDKTTNPWLMEP